MKKYLLILVGLSACAFSTPKESYCYSNVGMRVPTMVPAVGYGYRLVESDLQIYDFNVNAGTNLKYSFISAEAKAMYYIADSYISGGVKSEFDYTYFNRRAMAHKTFLSPVISVGTEVGNKFHQINIMPISVDLDCDVYKVPTVSYQFGMKF
jgi:hypothetical protein